MTQDELKYFEDKLNKAKQDLQNLLEKMRNNQTAQFGMIYSNELSNYDNHPADSASDVFEAEKNIALKADIKRRINLIEDAISRIKEGKYGICLSCKKDIPTERLESIPYTAFCIDCEREYEKNFSEENNRPIEEKVIGRPFNDKFNSQSSEEEYDGNNMWNLIEIHSTSNGPQDDILNNGKDYYKKINEIDDTVEDVDKLSNDDNKKFMEGQS